MSNVQLNDPDFDWPTVAKLGSNDSSQRSFFEQLSPKSAAIVGLVGGVLALGTLGFIILLSLYLTGAIKII